MDFPNRRSIEKLTQLAEGGEAVIYEYNKSQVIKLFKPKVDIKRKEKKIKYFISIRNKLPNNVICPTEIVTINGIFAGYLMPTLVGAEDMHMLIKPKFLKSSNFTNKDVLQIITKLGEDITSLHSSGVIIGDISDYNFQICNKDVFFIDVDSWGISGKFDPDAYTELFTCPDSYARDGRIIFNTENENYNFAVLAFNMLTRIHPYGGTYLPDKKLSQVERMKKRLSIVGKHKKDIKIPKVIGSWNWISPKLKQDFISIFDEGQKINITPDLQDLVANLKMCNTHGVYYYSKYNKCPLCDENAKVQTAPVVVVQTKTGPQITIVFSEKDCAYVLSPIHYMNNSGQIVHFSTKRKANISRGQKGFFSSDGKILYIVTDRDIKIYDESNKLFSTIERSYKSNFLVMDKNLYYVDKGNNLVSVAISTKGNMPTYLGQVYNPVFEVFDEKVFVVSTYPKKALVKTPDYTFEVDYTGAIKEYAIKYDRKTNTWLFVYQKSNGKYRTMLFYKDQIKYDDDIITYNAQTLGNIDFYNNTIYDPGDGKIVGINLSTNTGKEFPCSVVNEESSLKFTGSGFRIYNNNEIYNYG